jgi:hypothetical protein
MMLCVWHHILVTQPSSSSFSSTAHACRKINSAMRTRCASYAAFAATGKQFLNHMRVTMVIKTYPAGSPAVHV